MLDIVVCAYNMRIELLNTIHSMLPPYQEGVSIDQYNIVIIDNGSTDGTSASDFESISPNIRFLNYIERSRSPAPAINWVIENHTSAEYLSICIDGARIFSPNLLRKTFEVIELIPNSFIYTLGYHIGEKTHMILSEEGYSISEAREFLSSLDWRRNANLLRQSSVLAGSSRGGYFSDVTESNAFCLRRSDVLRIGAYNEGFISPGGGLCNLEIFARLVRDAETVNVCLLEEGTYHQFHGGAATGKKVVQSVFAEEYEKIMRKKYVKEAYPRFYY